MNTNSPAPLDHRLPDHAGPGPARAKRSLRSRGRSASSPRAPQRDQRFRTLHRRQNDDAAAPAADARASRPGPPRCTQVRRRDHACLCECDTVFPPGYDAQALALMTTRA